MVEKFCYNFVIETTFVVVFLWLHWGFTVCHFIVDLSPDEYGAVDGQSGAGVKA